MSQCRWQCPSCAGTEWGRRGIEGLSLQIRSWMRTGEWHVVGTSQEGARACPVLEQGSSLDFTVHAKRAARLEICSCKSCYLPTCLQTPSRWPSAPLPRFCGGEASCTLLGPATSVGVTVHGSWKQSGISETSENHRAVEAGGCVCSLP